MGLDMYAYVKTSETPENCSGNELKYWRKNNALHYWMYKLWSKKQGKELAVDDFNCESLQLTKEDVLQLRADIKNNELIPASGFFWGTLEYPDWRKEEDLNFCFRALDEIQDGATVTYCADW